MISHGFKRIKEKEGKIPQKKRKKGTNQKKRYKPKEKMFCFSFSLVVTGRRILSGCGSLTRRSFTSSTIPSGGDGDSGSESSAGVARATVTPDEQAMRFSFFFSLSGHHQGSPLKKPPPFFWNRFDRFVSTRFPSVGQALFQRMLRKKEVFHSSFYKGWIKRHADLPPGRSP